MPAHHNLEVLHELLRRCLLFPLSLSLEILWFHLYLLLSLHALSKSGVQDSQVCESDLVAMLGDLDQNFVFCFSRAHSVCVATTSLNDGTLRVREHSKPCVNRVRVLRHSTIIHLQHDSIFKASSWMRLITGGILRKIKIWLFVISFCEQTIILLLHLRALFLTTDYENLLVIQRKHESVIPSFHLLKRCAALPTIALRFKSGMTESKPLNTFQSLRICDTTEDICGHVDTATWVKGSSILQLCL